MNISLCCPTNLMIKFQFFGTKLKLLVFINTMKSIGNREEFELNKRVLPCSSYSYFGKEPMGC